MIVQHTAAYSMHFCFKQRKEEKILFQLERWKFKKKCTFKNLHTQTETCWATAERMHMHEMCQKLSK